jgi:two-component system, sensor histidine kinase ChiS
VEGFGGRADPGGDDAASFQTRLAQVQRERDHLVMVVEILQEISATLHFVDILQAIARRLGDSLALDRCAIFLTGQGQEVRLVASYEDPSIRNLVVDLNRYPELRRAFAGETVFVEDALSEPSLRAVRAQLEQRNVRSICVVPMKWQDNIIGAIFLRTRRDGAAFGRADVPLGEVVASLTAKALRNAHRFETLLREQSDVSEARRRAELQRIALVSFIRRLLDRYARAEDEALSETLLSRAADEELERLVGVAMEVLEEEAKG